MASKREVVKRGKCLNCRTAEFIIMDYIQGDSVCRNCGLVMESRIIDDTPEWRSFGADSAGSGEVADKSRAGTVINDFFHDMGSTSIGAGGKNAGALYRAQNMMANTNAQDRVLQTCMKHLKMIRDALCLKDNLMESCYAMIKTLEEANALRGKTTITHMCAIVYMACREQSGGGRSLRDIATGVQVILPAVQSVEQLSKDIGKAMMKFRRTIQCTTVVAAEELVSRFCNQLRFEFEVIKLAETIAKNASQWAFAASRWPQNLAVSSIYLAANILNVANKPTLGKICEVAMVNENTVQSAYREMRNSVTQLLPSDFQWRLPGGVESLPR